VSNAAACNEVEMAEVNILYCSQKI